MTDEEIVKAANYAVDLLVEKGMSKEAVVQELMAGGLDYDTANTVLDKIRVGCRKVFGDLLFFAILWLVGGLVFSIGTYEMASQIVDTIGDIPVVGLVVVVVVLGTLAILYGLIALVVLAILRVQIAYITYTCRLLRCL